MYLAIALWAYIISSPWNMIFSGSRIADNCMAGIAVCTPLAALNPAFFIVVFDHIIPPVGSYFVVRLLYHRRDSFYNEVGYGKI
jgi:hypothetical protein